MRARPLVLVIDDSDDTRDLLAAVLHLEGFIVLEAHDGHEGLKVAFESRPDIIIADLQMPVMDGWEAIQRLRADSRTRHIPIIVCSGEEPARKGDTPGDLFLPKPCPPDLLVSEVRGLVRRAS